MGLDDLLRLSPDRLREALRRDDLDLSAEDWQRLREHAETHLHRIARSVAEDTPLIDMRPEATEEQRIQEAWIKALEAVEAGAPRDDYTPDAPEDLGEGEVLADGTVIPPGGFTATPAPDQAGTGEPRAPESPPAGDLHAEETLAGGTPVTDDGYHLFAHAVPAGADVTPGDDTGLVDDGSELRGDLPGLDPDDEDGADGVDDFTAGAPEDLGDSDELLSAPEATLVSDPDPADAERVRDASRTHLDDPAGGEWVDDNRHDPGLSLTDAEIVLEAEQALRADSPPPQDGPADGVPTSSGIDVDELLTRHPHDIRDAVRSGTLTEGDLDRIEAHVKQTVDELHADVPKDLLDEHGNFKPLDNNAESYGGESPWEMDLMQWGSVLQAIEEARDAKPRPPLKLLVPVGIAALGLGTFFTVQVMSGDDTQTVAAESPVTTVTEASTTSQAPSTTAPTTTTTIPPTTTTGRTAAGGSTDATAATTTTAKPKTTTTAAPTTTVATTTTTAAPTSGSKSGSATFPCTGPAGYVGKPSITINLPAGATVTGYSASGSCGANFSHSHSGSQSGNTYTITWTVTCNGDPHGHSATFSATVNYTV